MKIIVNEPGASGAYGPRAKVPEVRFGITHGEIIDDGSPGMVTIVMPRKADAENLAGLFCYAAGIPRFSTAEWKLIMEATRAHAAAGHANDDTLENIANTVAMAHGWPKR